MSFAYIAVAGMVIQGIGTYQAGQEAKKAAEYNAKIDEQEAANIRFGAERETGIIKQNAVLNEYRQRKQLERETGTQVGAYAASGVDVGTGSPLDVIADDIANAELKISIDKWTAENQAAMTTYNAATTASGLESGASEQRRSGRATARVATLKAGGTLLSAAGKYKSTIGNKT